jgi:uncharacterized membrane protein (DUF4010 family)
MEPLSTVMGVLISIGLGGLVGLEREFKKEVENRKLLIGIRTSMFLCLLGYLSIIFGEFIDLNISLTLGFLCVLVALSLSYISRVRIYKYTGLTTFIAGILIFLVGVLVGFGENLLAVVLAVFITSILAVKEELHLIIKGMERDELLSAIKFSIITFVILPLLPNYTIDPFNLFNPYQFWLIVVIISLIELLSFLLMRAFENRGDPFVGFFGGFINSEATTYTIAEHTVQRKSTEGALSSILISILAMALSCIIVSAIIFPSVQSIGRLVMNLSPAIAILLLVSVSKIKFKKIRSKIKSPYSVVSAIEFAVIFFVLTLVGNFILNFSESLLLPASLFAGAFAATPVVASISLLMSSGKLDVTVGTMAICFSIIGSIMNKNFWARVAKNRNLSKQLFIYTTLVSLLTLTMILL